MSASVPLDTSQVESLGEKKTHRSVSQYNQFYRCGWAYKLSRIDKVWQRPAAWLAQGSGVHQAVELWEKSGRTMSLRDAQAAFTASYEEHVNRYAEQTPNFDYWSRSGPYAGEADILRRYAIGLEQVEKYITWALAHPDEKPWVSDDGEPGIEIGFDIELGGVPVRGFIDLVLPSGDSEVYLRDLKTGKTPGDDFQLGVYKVALEEQYGVTAASGDYFMAGKASKKAGPTAPYDLTEWTKERVTKEFQELEENIKAENFEPKPDPKTCMFCDVSFSCSYRAV